MSAYHRQVSRALALAVLAAPALATDWFVVAGAKGGDGSRGKPFHDPWRALAVASAGDTIHIAEGVYFGRHERGAWEIDRPRVTILGGYDRDFAVREPWSRPTVFGFNPDYEGASESNLLYGRDDHRGVVLDGLVIDGSGRNRYEVKPPRGSAGGLMMVGPLASFSSPEVVIRNCVFVNSSTGGVQLSGEGTRFENNLVLNHRGQATLDLREIRGAVKPIFVTGNTFAFIHDETDPPMGRGGEKGLAIRVGGPAEITDNAFAACGNAAVRVFAKPDRVVIARNQFTLAMRAHVSLSDGGKEYLIGANNLEEIEDLGFKDCAGNRVAAALPQGLPTEWFDATTSHLLFAYATPPREAIQALRASCGLGDAQQPTGDSPGALAPYLAPADACKLRIEGGGMRVVVAKVELAAAKAAAPAPSYRRLEWRELLAGAPGLEGQKVEVRVAVGNERHGFVLPGITQEQWLGFDVRTLPVEGLPDQIHVYAPRHGAAHRQWQDAVKSHDARQAEDWYLIQGTCRLTSTRQKATVCVDAIVATTPPEPPQAPAKRGRDWFVRAGASGGDGSREKPFRDPFQAMEKAGLDDVIHVAGGDYFGKLRSGQWQITTKRLSLYGGYDAEFKARDPWQNQTRMVLPADADKTAKAAHTGTFLRSEATSDALVLDGFAFDGATVNTYFTPGGGLDLRASRSSPLLQIRGLHGVIRNCMFANACGAAVDIGFTHGGFSNNVIVNSSGVALSMSINGPGPWHVHDNTILFAADPTSRAGTGNSSAGSLVLLSGRAAVSLRGNLLAFGENYGLRATVPLHKLRMDDNVLANNLAFHFSNAQYVWLHQGSWHSRLPDAGMLSARGNDTTLPRLQVDRDFSDATLPRLFALPGRYRRDDWVATAAQLGATVTPPADAEVPVVEAAKPAEKPKGASLEDLLGELDQLKRDSNKPTESKAPSGPPYCPAYPWAKVVELVGDAAVKVGARRAPLAATLGN